MEHVSSGKTQLMILALRHQPIKNGLSFLVEALLTGPFSDVWPELDEDMTLPELSIEVPFHQGERCGYYDLQFITKPLLQIDC